jgi:thiosulfate/3-mercaptopyruvate sulfurtransferase
MGAEVTTIMLKPKNFCRRWNVLAVSAAFLALSFASLASAADPWTSSEILEPAALAKQLESSKTKPVIVQVGFFTLYEQSHIPGAEYCGPARSPEGIAKLRQCVEKVSRSKEIVIYCGCCPWKDCPNIRPAFEELKKLGFKNLRVLNLPQTFGENWVKKGYPVKSGG